MAKTQTSARAQHQFDWNWNCQCKINCIWSSTLFFFPRMGFMYISFAFIQPFYFSAHFTFPIEFLWKASFFPLVGLSVGRTVDCVCSYFFVNGKSFQNSVQAGSNIFLIFLFVLRFYLWVRICWNKRDEKAKVFLFIRCMAAKK